MKLQLKRSNVLVSGAAKEPTAAQLDYGELAINYSTSDAAIFLKDSSNNVIRIAGVHNIADDGLTNVPTTTSPPTTPTPEAGNLWYNSEDGRLYIYYVDDNSSQWVDASPDTWQTTVIPDTTNPAHQAGTLDDRYVNINGDTLTGALLLDNAATVATPDLAFDGDANTGIYSPGADSLAITTAGTQRVVVDSSGNLTFSQSASSSYPEQKLKWSNDSTTTSGFYISQGTDRSGKIWHEQGLDIQFGTNNTERMRIDYSGRLLLNGGSDVRMELGTNGTTGTNDRNHIRADGDILKYNCCDNGQHIFEENGTERLRINSSGNVGIGDSAPSEKLNVGGNIMLEGSDQYIYYTNAGTGNSGIYIRGRTATAELRSHSTGIFTWEVTGNEKMRINSSGRLGIGTTSPDHVLHLSSTNTYLAISDSQDSGGGGILFRRTDNGQNRGMIQYNFSSDFMAFRTSTDGNGERMRITSLGATKMSNAGDYYTTNNSIHEMRVNNNNNWIALLTNKSTTFPYGISIRYTNTSPNDTSREVIHFEDSASTRFAVRSNGGIANFQSNNANLCDEREKKNIVSLDTKWDKVKSWELKKFHYNEDADTDDKRYGVIAQQVEEQCPEVLTNWIKTKGEDAVLDEDGNVVTPAVPEILRKGVKEQQMMWMAIKALQEAQERIETLESKVAALEAG